MHNLLLYTSNRLDYLAQILAGIVAKPLDPMTPETILVQSGGMQRWVSMHLARELGVWANARFPFPVAFAYELARSLLPDLSPDYALSKERMLWRIVGLLPGLADEPEFAPIKAYLADGDPLGLVQLAEKIAYHFDQYLIFRPLWATHWEQGQACGDLRQDAHLAAERWQARLWREVAQGFEAGHRAALLRRTMDALTHGRGADGLPPRLTVFGISTLPPSYLDLLLALSRRIPVHVFLLSPCRQYWGDLAGKREHLRDYRRLAQNGVTAEVRPEDMTPLASLGALGRDFHELLTSGGVEELPLYRDNPAPGTLLEHLREDLLDPARLEEEPGPDADLDDASIQLHCCHSPLREMEVLRELLLDLLQRDPSLEPRDILIMNPDIETYAPFIQAVFGCPDDPAQALPFSIADRRPSRAARQVRLLTDLMEFGQHRFEASRVLALLETPAIRDLLDLDEADCARIEDWVRTARIRWGADRTFRAEAGLAEHAQNTWESGLARLFLGYMTGPAPDPVAGVAPLGPLSSADQVLLGRLAGFLDRLRDLWTKLGAPGTAGQWRERLHWLVDTFFPQDRDTAETVLAIRAAITDLTEAMAAGAEQLQTDSRTMLHLLRSRLDEAGAEGGFLASGLTFCGLKPMRAIPFKVICLTGLSSTGFPRQDIAPGFDLMAASPRPGDRNHRDDDRYLFLESLVSARDTLILTYPGLSQTDNAQAPPSVLVAELFDYLDSRYTVRGGKPSEELTIKHRLQAFHPDYFRPDGNLFSHSVQNCRAAQALCGQPQAAPFFPATAGEAVDLDEVDLIELTRFLAHPVRHLLARLRVRPDRPEDEILDEEPLAAPDGLDGYGLGQDLLEACLDQTNLNQASLDQAGLDGADDARLAERLRAWQILPPGPAGRDASAELLSQARTLAETVRAEQGGAEPVFHDLSIEPDEPRATGRITGRVITHADRIVTARPAKTKGPDLLRLWVAYLAARAAGLSVTAAHVAKDGIFRAPDLDRATAARTLSELTELYRRGMTAPLPLLPRASLAFAEKRRAGKDRDTSLDAALTAWEGTMHVTPERDDPALALAYRDQDPDWEEFMTVTEQVYGPLLGGNHDA